MAQAQDTPYDDEVKSVVKNAIRFGDSHHTMSQVEAVMEDVEFDDDLVRVFRDLDRHAQRDRVDLRDRMHSGLVNMEPSLERSYLLGEMESR